jgi:DNA (cytosine-5)-methyltransferase 1
MTFGSLFAGIGGFDLGLERAGMECRWQVEIDPFCQKVLAKHWPDVKRYGDIREVGDNLERVDLICGGFPCQDISVAGPRVGLAGERSGLWSEYLRLVRLVRPRFVLVENVAALLGRGMARVVGDLADSGYDAEWQVIRASEFGAAHERERVWILAYPVRDGDEGFRPPRLFGEVRPWRESFAPTLPYGETAWHVATFGADSDSPWFLRTSDGLPDWAHRVRSLGNAIVPQIAEWIGRRIIESDRERQSA